MPVKYVPPTDFPPLEAVTKPNLTTKEFCHYTNLAEQTAWLYACKETGPIRPIRIGRKLNWPTSEVKKLCGVA
jgi:predicted DNA-binding transcriptional regulator AlpA